MPSHLNQQSPRHRHFIRLVRAGLSPERIAAELGLSVGYVRRKKCLLGLSREKPDLSFLTPDIVRLREVEGLTFREIASKVGCSEATVHKWYTRHRKGVSRD